MKICTMIKFMIILAILSTIGMSQPSTTIPQTLAIDTIDATGNVTNISTDGNGESNEADQTVDHDAADQEAENETGEAGVVETAAQSSPSFEANLFIVAIVLAIYTRAYYRKQ